MLHPECFHLNMFYTSMKSTVYCMYDIVLICQLVHVLSLSLFCLPCSESVPWGWTVANMLVLKKVRKALGFQQCKVFAVGAAPIKMETIEYFMSINIPIMNIYGKQVEV